MRRPAEPLRLELPEPDSEALGALRRRRAWIDDCARRGAAPDWRYLVISPLGLKARAGLERALLRRGVALQVRLSLDCYPAVDTALHLRGAEPAQLRRAVLYEAAWSALFPEAPGEAWGIDPSAHRLLAGEKRALRAPLPELHLRFGPGCGLEGALHAFHLADPEDAEAEARRLQAALLLPAQLGPEPPEHEGPGPARHASGTSRDRARNGRPR